MKRKVLSIVLALVLCLSLLPVAAFAEEPETYGLWVGGVEVNSENADDVLGDGTVSYERTSHTLTLNGAEITGATINEAKDTVGIYSVGQLAIVLVGENSIEVPDGDSSAGICVAGGLDDSGDLVIYGKGRLNVTAGDASNLSIGIYAENSVEISQAEVFAYGGEGAFSYGVDTTGLTIEEGGQLDAEGGEASNANNGAAYSAGVYISGSGAASGYAKVEDGYLYARGGDVSGERSCSYGVYGYNSSLFVTEDAVDATVYAMGGDAVGEDSCSYGIFVHGGNVGLLAGSTVVRAGEADNSYGIYAREYGDNTGVVIFQCDEDNISVLEGMPVFDATRVTIFAAEGGTAVHADGGIVLDETLTISEPEGGYIDSEDICGEDGKAAERVDIELLTYKVTISGLKSSSTQGINVPVGWSINETYGEDFYDKLTGSASKNGYILVGLTTEDGRLYSFDTPVTEDIELTAKWVPENALGLWAAAPGSSDEVSEDSTQLELLLSRYDASAESKYFVDVHPVAHWATEAIDFVVAKGVFSGTGADTFSPDAPMTRGMLAVVLYNLEGKPGHSYGGSFEDVAQGSWYEEAVYWAAEKGIVTGYGDGSFGPEDNITREQLAVMLYRYAQYKGYDTAQGGMAIREFGDFDSISEYAMQAMTWTVNTGIIGGYSDNTLGPQNTATRAQVAKMLMKFIVG